MPKNKFRAMFEIHRSEGKTTKGQFKFYYKAANGNNAMHGQVMHNKADIKQVLINMINEIRESKLPAELLIADKTFTDINTGATDNSPTT